MEKKEYLNEEEYLKNAKKLKKIGKTTLIVGVIALILGVIIIALGLLGFGKAATDSIGSFESDPSGVVGGALGGVGLFILGGGSISLGFTITMIGGIILFIAHRREITAFTIQQTMPLAQEGIEKMTPTVSNAAGSLAKSITKGIKDGLKEE